MVAKEQIIRHLSLTIKVQQVVYGRVWRSSVGAVKKFESQNLFFVYVYKAERIVLPWSVRLNTV